MSKTRESSAVQVGADGTRMSHYHSWRGREIDAYRKLYMLRALLEGFAAAEVASIMKSGGSIEIVRQSFERLEKSASSGDHAKFLERDMEFHRSIIRRAGVPRLEDLWIILEAELRDFVVFMHQILYGDTCLIAGNHDIIWHAIISGDPENARSAAEAHFDSIWQAMEKHLSFPDSTGDPVERACGYLLCHLHEHVSLADMARNVAYLSLNQLERRFKKAKGITITKYLQNLRLERAAIMICKTCIRICAVADRVGYHDASRFTQHFYRHFGMTPGEMRRAST